jgi:hypothetical protein
MNKHTTLLNLVHKTQLLAIVIQSLVKLIKKFFNNIMAGQNQSHFNKYKLIPDYLDNQVSSVDIL